MGINYIFNGYYRSGTTIIWKILRESNPNYKVFYEPLNPTKSDPDQYDFKIHPLHNESLWDEYLKEDNLKQKLIKNYPFKNKVPYCKFDKLKEYIDVFNNLNGDVILQTNRLFFYLDKLLSQYQLSNFHIVRNPIDVYNSFKKIYKDKSLLRRFKNVLFFIRKGIHPMSLMWEITETIEGAYEKYNMPGCWNDVEVRNELLKSPFQIIFLSWVVSNYWAIRSIEKSNQFVILYEMLVNKPKKVKEKVENNTKLNFNINEIRTKKTNLEKYKNVKLMNLANDLNLESEYEYIVDYIYSNFNF